MKNTLKLLKLLVLPLAVLSFAGCGKVPVLENGQEAVATTKEGNISANDLYEKMKNVYGRDALIDLIDKLILDEKYEETDDEKDYIDEQISKLEESAEEYGVTYSYLINYYGFADNDAVNDYFRLDFRRQQAVKDYLKDDVTEKEINKYYEDNIYGDIKAKHILIEADVLDGMTSEEKTKAENDALTLAKDIIKKLDKGEKFDDLAKKYSDDKSNASKGGDLGWFNTGEMESTFEEAAFALKKGKYTTTPVKTSYGYHIIYKTDEKSKPELKDVKDTIIETLVEEKLTNDTKLYNETLRNIRKDSKLEIVDSYLKKEYEDYMDELKNATTQTN